MRGLGALKYSHVFVCSERGKNANFSSLKPRRNADGSIVAQFPIYIFRFGDVQVQVIFESLNGGSLALPSVDS